MIRYIPISDEVSDLQSQKEFTIWERYPSGSVEDVHPLIVFEPYPHGLEESHSHAPAESQEHSSDCLAG